MHKRTTWLALLAAGILAGLGLILRLIAIHGGDLLPLDGTTRIQTPGGLALIGGGIVLGWGSLAVWAAKRLTKRTLSAPAAPRFKGLDIHQDTPTVDGSAVVKHLQLEIPATWSPENRYILGHPHSQFKADWHRLQLNLDATQQQTTAIVNIIHQPMVRPSTPWRRLAGWIHRQRHSPGQRSSSDVKKPKSTKPFRSR